MTQQIFNVVSYEVKSFSLLDPIQFANWADVLKMAKISTKNGKSHILKAPYGLSVSSVLNGDSGLLA